MSALQEIFARNKKPCWYALVVYIGKEADVKKEILKLKELSIEEIVIPEKLLPDEDIGLEAGELHKYFLGYIFIKTLLDLDVYHGILQTVGIFRFLGTVKTIGKFNVYYPSPIKEKEIENVKDFLIGKHLKTIKFKIDDIVEIKKGDLAEVKGKVIEIGQKHVKILPDNFFQKVIVVPIENVAKYNTAVK
jgi:transcription antitermination factor NusG